MEVLEGRSALSITLLIRRFEKLKRFVTLTGCLAIVAFGILGNIWIPNAYAVGAEGASEIVNQRATKELDRVAGAGTSDKLEGALDSAVGTIKRKASEIGGSDIDQAARKLDGATDELKSKVKRDVGRAKGAAADARDDLEDASEGIVDSIKEFFD